MLPVHCRRLLYLLTHSNPLNDVSTMNKVLGIHGDGQTDCVVLTC